MHPDFCGKAEMQIETVTIAATPEAIAWGREWRTWRITRSRWKLVTTYRWCRYYAWWWKCLLLERKVPKVILEIF